MKPSSISIALLFLMSFATCLAADNRVSEIVSEKEILSIINEFRASYGACNSVSKEVRPTLGWNDILAQLARDQSGFLAKHADLSHAGINGKKLAARVDESEYNWLALAENIAQSRGDAQDVLRLWLNSDSHKKNMCSSDYSEIGVANLNGYWTAIFAQPYGR